MRFSIIVATIILMTACTKEFNNTVVNLNEDGPILIETYRSAGNSSEFPCWEAETKSASDNDPVTITRQVSCFESVVLPELQPHIWLGNVLMKKSIINCIYRPILYSRNPITASTTIIGAEPFDLSSPSQSRYMMFIQDQVANGKIAQNGEFNYTVEQFTSYKELKYAFGSNVNTESLFWSSENSEQSNNTNISKATGLYVKFYQSSFKAIIDYPIDIEENLPENLLDSAVYVNSITYGRLGIMTLETNESFESAQRYINKIYKGIFTSSSYTMSTEEKKFLESCSFKVYLIGGNGSTSVETFSGLEAFLQHIKKGSFSIDEPGAPIFCTFNHVKDHSPVSVDFVFSIKKDPLFVEICYENESTEQHGFNIDKYANVVIKFYKNRSKIPVIAPLPTELKVIEKKISVNNAPIRRDTTYQYHSFYNTQKGTSINMGKKNIYSETRPHREGVARDPGFDYGGHTNIDYILEKDAKYEIIE
ncbi:MAG: thiol-activated cytolysin family protein [Candidatus Cryptobacteroides sp.]